MTAPAPFSNVPNISEVAVYPWPASCDDVVFERSPESESKFSLIFIIDRAERKLLLGTKNRGFGCGIVNGYGGKIEKGESMDTCAVRELKEESGLIVSPDDMIRRGRLVFTFANPAQPLPGPREVYDIALYAAETWSGEPQETEEMSPCWYPIDDLPLDSMWPEFRIYFPHLLELVSNDQKSQLLARFDYDIVGSDHTSPVPSLQALGIYGQQRKRTEQRPTDGQDVEAVVGYWVGLAAC